MKINALTNYHLFILQMDDPMIGLSTHKVNANQLPKDFAELLKTSVYEIS